VSLIVTSIPDKETGTYYLDAIRIKTDRKNTDLSDI
jgi:hypothetical protein